MNAVKAVWTRGPRNIVWNILKFNELINLFIDAGH